MGKGGVSISDGMKYSGSRAATLTISNVLANDAAGYSVIDSSTDSSVTSAVAQLTVIDPAIITQPASLSVHAGTNGAFTVGAAGTGPLQYQWYKWRTAFQWREYFRRNDRRVDNR